MKAAGKPVDLVPKAAELRRLHHAPRPLVLPNAWDVASARAVEAAGFAAVATSSAAVAESLGHEDADAMPPDDVFALVGRVARWVRRPVTADCEAGYGLDPQTFVHRLLDAGAVGCNLEDTNHHGGGGLVPIGPHVRFLNSVKDAARTAGIDIVLNARIDIFLRTGEQTDGVLREGIERGIAYRDAGADCLYPIGLTDERLIERFVERVNAPVNVWLRPDGPALPRLASLGVARISLATGLFRTAQAAISDTLETLRAEIDAL